MFPTLADCVLAPLASLFQAGLGHDTASALSIALPALLWAHTGGLKLLALTLVHKSGLGPGTQGVLGGLPVNPLGAGGGFLCGPMGAALR